MHAFADGGSAAAGAAAGKAKQIVRGMPESEARMILNVDQKAGDADVVEVRTHANAPCARDVTPTQQSLSGTSAEPQWYRCSVAPRRRTSVSLR